MALLETATDYIFGILTEDETIKNFPKEWVGEAAKWIRSWFLKDDTKLAAKIEAPERTTEQKKAAIEHKLEDLLEQPAFKAALEQQLAAFETQKSKYKNVVTDSDIEAQGNIHFGDSGTSSGDNYDEKNIIKNSTIKAGGDFHLGDNIAGNQNAQIIHNYFGKAPQSDSKTPTGGDQLKKDLKKQMANGKIETVIEQLLDLTDGKDNDLYNTVLLLSARFNRVKKQEMNGILTQAEAGIERVRINNALLSAIDALEAA